MDRLLELLRGLFTGTDQIQKLLAALVERLLAEIDDPKDCKEHLLKMLKEGTLDDHFREDPLCVVVCIAYVVLEFVGKDHDHDHDPSMPIVIGDDPLILEYAEALDVQQPAGGPLTNLFIQIITAKLIDLLEEYLKQWLG